ncbi:MAG: succinylglutamate desuccinylase/aspartoacylase family protein [Planctomycetota bacterium]
MSGPRLDVGQWGEQRVAPGDSMDVAISLGRSYSGVEMRIPVHVWRAPTPGPTVFLTGAIHGDEINGTGSIRKLILEKPFALVAGTLLLVPVVNVLGFERHSRYLPDRKDPNRCFPGSAEGSLSSRFASVVFREIVTRCDYGIDLHTASLRRTNFPNVRGDLTIPEVERLARAFGCEVVVDSAGPQGAFRREACKAGCPTILLEAGEVWKVEPAVVEYTLRGVRNVLIELGMVEGRKTRPPYQVLVKQTRWLRSPEGGFLHFHVAPGELVRKGERIATVSGLLGAEHAVVDATRTGIVVGMTTLPAVGPGDAICHLAYLTKKEALRVDRAMSSLPDHHLHERMREDLASNVMVSGEDED